MKLPILIVLAAATAGAVFFALRRTSDREPVQPVTETAVPGSQAKPAPLESNAAAPKAELQPELRLYFPDGSYLPALNGATNAKMGSWPRDRPYSPVIGKERDTRGNEWYVHEDGSKTTTIMGWREDLKRYDAITQVANPVPTAPYIDAEEALRNGTAPAGATPPTTPPPQNPPK